MTQKEARDRMIRRMRLDGSTMQDIDFSETPAEARERMVARLHGDDQEFESKHKRDKDGRFAKMSEGASPDSAESGRGSEGSKESGRGSGKENGGQSPDKATGASKSKASNGSKSEGGESAKARSNPARQAISAKPVRPIDTPEGKALYDGIMSGKLSNEEIKNSPLIQQAQAKADADKLRQTQDDKTPEREALRNQVANDQFKAGSFSGKDEHGNEVFDGKVDKGFRAEIVIGPPASGKSSVICNRVSKDTHSRIVDSDEIKKCLPEFKDGEGAGRVHEESSDILNERVLPQLYKGGAHCGENVVIPIVGAKSKKALLYLEKFKEAGYEVHLSFNDVEPEKFFRRAMLRYLKTGRYIDYTYLEGIGHKCQDTFKELEEMGGFDGYEKYDNNAERSEKPTKKDGKGGHRHMDEKKRKYFTGDYLKEADLTEEEKKKIWNFIYENSSTKKGEHDLEFTKNQYAHCMRREGAIENLLERIDEEEEGAVGKMRNCPGNLLTFIVYAE